ncbi:ImmA/IrrE family metallo-endopeptidase [Acinetobacter sp. GSS19]|uniref:ImmA/IrrE family metallo-endopeptidase n=1 Tax=Acinetobacter sp. GSS19 TaxID=3020716 RepID=UPI00235EE27E|nr:ImmA/IrrE family metallo-endopeptidase [Acinetobacter sp. GSS19]
MFGERLLRARSSNGLSMKDLANQVGLSANMIKKYEHGDSLPSSDILLKLAKALNLRVEYFFRPVKISLGQIEYRKKANASQKQLQCIKNDVLDQVERWFDLSNQWPVFPVPNFSLPTCVPNLIQSLDEIEQLADNLRQEWQLGFDHITDLIDLLESRGILVVVSNAVADGSVDGLQMHANHKPILVVSGHVSGDRQRFTLAHELAHLLIHGHLAENIDEEKACHRFASAFLLPAIALHQRLGNRRHNIELQELYLLKHEFGISMSACAYRAKELGIINESLHKRIMIKFSKNKWRQQEPGEAYPQEKTTFFRQLVFRALAEEIVSDSKAAELLGISLIELRQVRKLELLNAAFNQ